MYRLISRDTYEMALFSTASRKYGEHRRVRCTQCAAGLSVTCSTFAAELHYTANVVLRVGAHI